MNNKSGRLAREAARVQSAGRDGDTLVAHINPSEAQILKALGGRGTINPKTGLMEFATQSNFDPDTYRRLNPDVAAAGVDPWQHYQQFGQSEGRAANSAEEAARAEGYSGGFGSGGYVDWKNQQAVTPAPTYDNTPGSHAGTPSGWNSLPGTGAIRNLTMPNGSTIQIREDDPDFARIMSQGAADQGSTQASGYSAASWYAPGGQGYLDAMRGGHNDPTSDPSNPQPFSAAARQQYNNGLLAPTPSGGGGLLSGGGNGGGSNGGFPASTIPIFSNVGGMSQQPSMQPSMPMPSMAAPTIGNFEAQQVTPAPQTFDDILAKYSLYSTPLQNGTGFNWITPQTTPGSVNIMDANLSRRYL
jgi:hypothetical protein